MNIFLFPPKAMKVMIDEAMIIENKTQKLNSLRMRMSD